MTGGNQCFLVCLCRYMCTIPLAAKAEQVSMSMWWSQGMWLLWGCSGDALVSWDLVEYASPRSGRLLNTIAISIFIALQHCGQRLQANKHAVCVVESVGFKVLRGVSKTIPEWYFWTSEEHVWACSGSCVAHHMGNCPGVQRGPGEWTHL